MRAPPDGTRKAKLGTFLASNPFPNPLTDGFFYREKMRAIHAVAPAAGVRRVLEVGGGRSGMGGRLYPDAHVVTADIDPAHAASANLNSSFVCADARKLPFAAGAFDVVSLFDVLEHIGDDAAATREALRVARPGGWVLVTTPAADWRYPRYRVLSPICPHERELMREWGHVRRGYTLERLQGLFGAAPDRTSSFINPLTALCHDIAFSRLSSRRRKALHLLISPITAAGYLGHRLIGRGSEICAAWRKAS